MVIRELWKIKKKIVRMIMKEKMAALFDLDGVVLDTETQYTHFWDEQGLRYLGRENFCASIKGQTLTQIFEGNFGGDLTAKRAEITEALNEFERNMVYEYVAGAREFIEELKRGGVRMAVVTSSNEEKMRNVYRTHPEFADYFDAILTGEMFARSKPHPDCFLLGMERLGTTAEQTVVFEDSFHGLTAGRSSGAFVVGLATTNPREAIAGMADVVVDDFRGMSLAGFKELLHGREA
jgi:HAD superfamily hydrolase (TIGR01509 family)